MITYPKLIQGSDEWKEFRHGKAGGTTAKKAMTNLDKSIRSCAVFNELLSEHMEDFDPFQSDYKSYSMARGNEYEPLAREEYERVTGNKVSQIGWACSDSEKRKGISPDGIVYLKNKSIEIKCPEATTHVKYMLDFNDFLEEYCWQIVDNFLILGVDSVDCISYRPENKIKPIIIFTVTKETEIKISAKVIKKVSELVEMLDSRLNELFAEIDAEIEKQNNKELQF